jgi:CHC2 zinc finger
VSDSFALKKAHFGNGWLRVAPLGRNLAIREEAAMTIKEVLSKLKDVKQCGAGWSAHCPAHHDEHPSLTVKETEDGQILFHCHAECSFEAIRNAIGFTNIVDTYDYQDETGNLLYQMKRTSPKGFFLCRPYGKGGFTNGLGDAHRVLYRLPELLKASMNDPVLIPKVRRTLTLCVGLDCDGKTTRALEIHSVCQWFC